MTKQYVKIHNVETDEIIEREMTAEELRDYEARKSEETTAKALAEEIETAKAALLNRLNITEDEAKLLLS